MAGLQWQSGGIRAPTHVASPSVNKTQGLSKIFKNNSLSIQQLYLEEWKKKTDDALRFQIELEFVQSLANPHYLHFLAQNGHFKDEKLVNYITYLQYWKEPQYAKYLKFPQCLHVLDLLQYEVFRKELVNPQCAKFIDDQMLLHWQHYQRKRTRLINNQQEKTQSQGQSSQQSGGANSVQNNTAATGSGK